MDLLQGIIIGILISIPLGPVGLITMRRTAQFGLRAGVISGLAIVFIDTLAAALVLLGLHTTVPYIKQLPPWLHIVGGCVIFAYGIRILLSAPLQHAEKDLPWHRHFLSSLLVALSNPSTYFSFGIIALLLTRFIDQPLFARVEVIVGFFIGALLWWCTLAMIAFTQRARYLGASGLQRVVGFIIIILAVITFFGPHRIHSPYISFISPIVYE